MVYRLDNPGAGFALPGRHPSQTPSGFRWAARVLLPIAGAILVESLRLMWDEPRSADRYMDLVGTGMLLICIISIGIWAVCAWLDDNRPDRQRPSSPER